MARPARFAGDGNGNELGLLHAVETQFAAEAASFSSVIEQRPHLVAPVRSSGAVAAGHGVWGPEVFGRLAAIKAAYDPANVFRDPLTFATPVPAKVPAQPTHR